MKIKLVSQKKKGVFIAGIIFFLLLSVFSVSQSQHVLKLSVKDSPNFSRVIIEASFPLSYGFEKRSSYLKVRIGADVAFQIKRDPFYSRLIRSLSWSKERDDYILTIRTKSRDFNYDYFTVLDPPQLVIDFSPLGEGSFEARAGLKRKEDLDRRTNSSLSSRSPSAKESLSSLRGIKTIVIDPGHGGLEPGAKGRYGTLEKDITLAVSLKLRDIIEQKFGFHVVLTREEDVEISLENRAAKANNNKAYLFISIHTNSSYRKDAHGPETFFLSSEATDEEARKLAYLENNPAEIEEGITGESEDEIAMILWDMAQSAHLKQSSLLAESIQKELNSLFRTRNRGIKQAPFKVLTGVACPAVLVEVAFISNSDEERNLLQENFQREIAQRIYQGLVNFIELSSQE